MRIELTLESRWGVKLVLLAALLGGCAVPGELRGPLAGLGEPDGLISEARESELGAREHPKIVATFGGVYRQPALQSGLEALVNRLTRVSERPDLRYKVTVLNSSTVNAFALPGGYVYVTRGLLALANDEDELAAVLAHEIGHVTARHAAKRQNEAIKAVFLGRVRSVGTASASSNALGDSDDLIASFSRKQELEADQIGVETSVRAGFDPFAAASFLDSMGRDTAYRQQRFGREKDVYRPDLETSHPSTPERIERVRKLARDFGFSPGKRPRSRVSYLTMIDGLLYGDDPRDGYVRGRTFLHPDLKIAFSVPSGYILHNAQDAVFAIGPDDTALRFDGVEIEAGQTLDEYVRSVWGRGATIQSVNMVTGDGLSSVQASAQYDGWDYRLAAIQGEGGDVYRFLLARRGMNVETERAFQSIVASLHRLGDEEAKALRPLRLHRITIKPGDTVSSMALKMSAFDDPEKTFRLLNGMGPHDGLRAGDSVKIITDE